MKPYSGVLAVVLAVGCCTAVPAIAQDDHHDRDQSMAQSRDESAYYTNPYYKRGWNNGLHHKKANYHWKNDDDRQAYEAGYAHGERGEKWQNPDAARHDHDAH
jgi:hypothetical protein